VTVTTELSSVPLRYTYPQPHLRLCARSLLCVPLPVQADTSRMSSDANELNTLVHASSDSGASSSSSYRGARAGAGGELRDACCAALCAVGSSYLAVSVRSHRQADHLMLSAVRIHPRAPSVLYGRGQGQCWRRGGWGEAREADGRRGGGIRSGLFVQPVSPGLCMCVHVHRHVSTPSPAQPSR
jgi:hypothetical protein